MNGDSGSWIRRAAATSGGLVAPEFTMTVGGFELGPLLSRALHGGIFALRAGGQIVDGRAVQVSTLGPHDPGDAALSEFSRLSLGQTRAGVARVFGAGIDGNLRWVEMERVAGWSLRTLLGRREITFTGRRLAMIGAELADALAPLHAAGAAFGLVHGRLGTGHVLVDRSGRLRLCGVPVARSVSALPDAIGVGAIVACAALGICPDPRGVTLATARSLAHTLDRPENTARMPVNLRRLVQSILLLHPSGFLPSMAVLRDQFLAFGEGLPLGLPDPAWGRALCEAVRGLPPTVRPSSAEVDAVIEDLAPQLPELSGMLPIFFAPPERSSPATPALTSPRMPAPVPDALLDPVAPAHIAVTKPVDAPVLGPPPPAFEMPILPSLHDDAPAPRPRSMRQRIFPLLVR